jgi:hypothetical protein
MLAVPFFSAFGLVCALAVAIIIFGIVAVVLRQRQIATLQRTGTRVVARVTNILHERIQTNAGAPLDPVNHPGVMQAPTYRDVWHVEAEWTDPQTGTTHRFRSEALTRTVAERYPAGSPITVLINLNDPSQYFVEIAK